MATTTTARGIKSPACPHCGERQAYDDARPSKPIVVKHGDLVRVCGRFVWKPTTMWHTHCRACDERIIWSMQYGSGSISELMTGKASYSWAKP